MNTRPQRPARRLARALAQAPIPTTLALLLAASAGRDLRAQQSIAAVWERGTDAHELLLSRDWDDFTRRWKEFEATGLRMDDFEVSADDGQVTYVGSFREGAGRTAAWISSDWDDFESKWQELGRQGLRMQDLETYVVDGRRWFAGMFGEGTDAHAAWVVKDWGDFEAKWAELEQRGLRMHDFETYVEDGARWYAGVFRAGDGPRAALVKDDWGALRRGWLAFDSVGLRLVDLEVYRKADRTLYAGIFRPGSAVQMDCHALDWRAFRRTWRERREAGYRLVDVEVVPAECLSQPVMPEGSYDYGIARSPTHCRGRPGTCSPPGARDVVLYRAPIDHAGGRNHLRLSAIDVRDQIFTLPFRRADLSHNGWLLAPDTFHHAVDYSTGEEKKPFPVLAAAPGTVVYVGWDPWSGNTVIVSHDVPGSRDRYRTVYMHLLDGARHDCAQSWSQSVGFVSEDMRPAFTAYLRASGCRRNGGGTLDPAIWGHESDRIAVVPGQIVQRGEVLGTAGSTGPGGCGRCNEGIASPNHHLHVFFAHRDPEDALWYLFDPYGVYGPPDCYPTRRGAGKAGQDAAFCWRHTVAWLGGAPRVPSDPM